MAAGVHKIAVLKIFKIQGNYKSESIFSKVEDLIFATFLKMNYITDIYLESCKTFWTTILRKWFFFNISEGSTVFTNRLVLFFCDTNLTTRKSVFWQNFQWRVGAEHLVLTAWKRYYSIVRIVSVCYVEAEDCNACLHETLSTW